MIDVKLPLRRAYAELLSGVLTYGGNILPVGDEASPYPQLSNIYVILSSQTDTDNSTFQSFDSTQEINIDIVFKAASRANKEVVDTIANQILSLVLPFPQVHGLPAQTGIQILNVIKVADRDVPMLLNNSNTVIRRILTFRQYIRQTQNVNPVAAISKIIHVTSAGFANSTDYVSSDLFGKQYEIYYNESSVFLEYGVDWDYLSNLGQPGNGGFRIFINNFNALAQSHDFYVLLK